MKVRGGGRGGRLGLTRDKVVDAALAEIDRDGPDSFSLRKLAGEPGVEAMSLYDHVPNKDALLDGVAEALIAGLAAQVGVPYDGGPGGPRRTGAGGQEAAAA
ncbi:TetR family transcriptional regulator [Streptomyces sp. NBC_00203]|uniref:TetR family transcriptional regulator n=1 Tax=Streptomyces sp. NBC_00203 TaxID=2975680 RepID=UPI0032496281